MKKIVLTILLLLGLGGVARADHVFGLHTGQLAPDFTANDHAGNKVTLSEMYQKGPVVLLLYRGGWCYYCNLQLNAYNKRLADFQTLGVTVMAVSVDLEAKASDTVKDQALGFTVVANSSADILQAYNAIFQVPAELAKIYKDQYDIDLQEHSGRDDRIIAVPATYVIDQNGLIVFSHSDEDYKVRPTVKDVIQFINNHFKKGK